jgi:hypothetical protein
MYIIKIPFSYAHGGTRVEEFQPCESPVPLSDECAQIAVREGWAVPADTRLAKAVPRAPRTKRIDHGE